MRVTNSPTFRKPSKAAKSSATKKGETVIAEPPKGLGLRSMRLVNKVRFNQATRI